VPNTQILEFQFKFLSSRSRFVVEYSSRGFLILIHMISRYIVGLQKAIVSGSCSSPSSSPSSTPNSIRHVAVRALPLAYSERLPQVAKTKRILQIELASKPIEWGKLDHHIHGENDGRSHGSGCGGDQNPSSGPGNRDASREHQRSPSRDQRGREHHNSPSRDHQNHRDGGTSSGGKSLIPFSAREIQSSVLLMNRPLGEGQWLTLPTCDFDFRVRRVLIPVIIY
jgi:hypothetical protein